MFNFHKPRTYRSAEGCCICRAKSSSSRFTDSRKYERDTMLCFDLKYPRQGEICNACVLLVKRFKRLPVGSKRNWSHVVDARAGPGGSKIQTKYKSERLSTRVHQTSNGTAAASPPSSSSCLSNSSAGGSPNSAVNGHSMSFLPEKFSKIFKKSKKVKESSSSLSSLLPSSTSASSSFSSSAKRKSSSSGWSHNVLHSLPTTPDSLDSDYEDSRIHHSTLAGAHSSVATVVQFQTQTRASAFRAQAAAEARRRSLKLGSKRRKSLQPRKNRRTTTYEETLNFYDEEEWEEQKSCCGMLYECPALGGALIVDVANYRPCEKHQKSIAPQSVAAASTSVCEIKELLSMSLAVPTQKPIIHSIPAVVQLQPPALPTLAATTTMLTSCCSSTSSSSSILLGTTTSAPSALTITKSTPVLKKHHLFFKRQSECFPKGDMVTPSETAANYYSSSNPVNTTKTEPDYNNQAQYLQLHQQHQQHQQQHHHHQLQHQYPHHQSTIFQRHNEHAIHSSAAAAPTNFAVSSSSALSISVTSVGALSSMPMSTPFTSTMPQMPKHSLAKVTTISPPLSAASHATFNSSLPLSKPHSFLHKIKSDTGKIVKHSLEKFNTAVRLKTSDLHDMKPIIKTVDKSYILAKPPTATANINTLINGPAATTYQTLSTYSSAAQPPLTTASLSAASPTSSTSSTSSTKFSDNSSDSGFDENMLDRKSASPLQEDCEKKLLSRPGVQTMFLASGVQIQGQPQNLVLTGNEVAAKILQNRKYSSITTTPVTSNTRILPTNHHHHHHPTTTAVKIAQISTGNGVGGGGPSSASSSVMSSAAQAKMRAIYNNSNTIQHENGITTIVPASSLAASTQMAAMQNFAPSTVTITPAPSVGGGAVVTTQFNAQNIISRKLTAANIINLQSNTLSNTTNLNSSNSNSGGNHFNSAAANQKIILLKTSPHTTMSSSSASSTATVTKYSIGGGGGR